MMGSCRGNINTDKAMVGQLLFQWKFERERETESFEEIWIFYVARVKPDPYSNMVKVSNVTGSWNVWQVLGGGQRYHNLSIYFTRKPRSKPDRDLRWEVSQLLLFCFSVACFSSWPFECQTSLYFFLSFRLLGFRISRVPISSRTWIMWKPTALPVWSTYLDSIHDQSYSLCTFQEPTLLIAMSQSEPPWPLVKLPSYHLDW